MPTFPRKPLGLIILDYTFFRIHMFMKETDCIKITIPVKLLRCCILNLLFCIHIYLYPITLLKTRIKFKQEMILSPKVLKKTLPVLQ